MNATPTGRLRHYIAMRDAHPVRQGADIVHGIHAGTEWEADLRLSDLRTILDRIAALERVRAAAEAWEGADHAYIMGHFNEGAQLDELRRKHMEAHAELRAALAAAKDPANAD